MEDIDAEKTKSSMNVSYHGAIIERRVLFQVLPQSVRRPKAGNEDTGNEHTWEVINSLTEHSLNRSKLLQAAFLIHTAHDSAGSEGLKASASEGTGKRPSAKPGPTDRPNIGQQCQLPMAGQALNLLAAQAQAHVSCNQPTIGSSTSSLQKFCI